MIFEDSATHAEWLVCMKKTFFCFFYETLYHSCEVEKLPDKEPFPPDKEPLNKIGFYYGITWFLLEPSFFWECILTEGLYLTPPPRLWALQAGCLCTARWAWAGQPLWCWLTWWSTTASPWRTPSEKSKSPAGSSRTEGFWNSWEPWTPAYAKREPLETVD